MMQRLQRKLLFNLQEAMGLYLAINVSQSPVAKVTDPEAGLRSNEAIAI